MPHERDAISNRTGCNLAVLAGGISWEAASTADSSMQEVYEWVSWRQHQEQGEGEVAWAKTPSLSGLRDTTIRALGLEGPITAAQWVSVYSSHTHTHWMQTPGEGARPWALGPSSMQTVPEVGSPALPRKCDLQSRSGNLGTSQYPPQSYLSTEGTSSRRRWKKSC